MSGSTMSTGPRPRGVLVVLVGLLFLAAPPLFVGGYDLFRISLILLYAAAATGLNLLLGYSGQLFLGHAAVMAVSAFTAGILNVHFGWFPILALPVSLAVAVAVACLIGTAGLRLKGFYLATVSFLVVLVLPSLADLWPEWTGGEEGLTGVQRFGLVYPLPPAYTYLIAALVLVVCVVVARNVVKSGWGLRLLALRDIPAALPTMGISPNSTKITAYALSGVSAGLAGWMLAFLNGTVGTGFFGLQLTLLLLAAVELGGRGSLVGPILGTVVLQGFSLWVGPFSPFNIVGVGVALLVVVVLFPRGLAGIAPAVTVARVRVALGAPAPAESPPEPTDDEEFTAVDTRHLRASGVVKRFGGNLALDHAELDIAPGRIVGLIGPNGSGKTTLVNVLTGVVVPDEGTVTIGDVDITGRSAAAVSRLGVARTFQAPQLIGELTVLQNIEAGVVARYNSGLLPTLMRTPSFRRTERRRREVALTAARTAGVPADRLAQAASSLPLGLKRIVEVARAVASGASVLCLDEPAAGLNDTEITTLGQVLMGLRDRGHTIVLVEHNLPMTLEVADDIVLLMEGRAVVSSPDHRHHSRPAALVDFLAHVPRLATADAAVTSAPTAGRHEKDAIT